MTAEHIVAALRAQGFTPSTASSPHYVEFHKDYADDYGRRARAIAQFERTAGGVRLSGFSAIVQAAIEPTLEAVETRAPPVMQSDLAQLLETFESGIVPTSIVVKVCSRCSASVNEYFVEDDLVVCRGCKEFR